MIVIRGVTFSEHSLVFENNRLKWKQAKLLQCFFPKNFMDRKKYGFIFFLPCITSIWYALIQIKFLNNIFNNQNTSLLKILLSNRGPVFSPVIVSREYRCQYHLLLHFLMSSFSCYEVPFFFESALNVMVHVLQRTSSTGNCPARRCWSWSRQQPSSS